jgi:release factor glutamine methyltransferase
MERSAGAALAEALNQAAARLRTAGIAEARREARLLLGAATGLGRGALLAEPGRLLTGAEREGLVALVERRARREPMAYVLGRREFWSLDLRVGPGVLVPRPETETVVEAVLDALPDRNPPLRVLDLGTGSGCLLLALLSELPNATGTGVDAAPEALATAAANAAALGLDRRAAFRPADWGRGLSGRYDVVVSNPPYIPRREIDALEPEVRDFEPRGALDGGADGLDAYRRLATEVPRLLAPEGLAALEIGQGQAEAVTAIMAGGGLDRIAVRRDLIGIERCLVFRGRQVPAKEAESGTA